jgi:uncharacterized protein
MLDRLLAAAALSTTIPIPTSIFVSEGRRIMWTSLKAVLAAGAALACLVGPAMAKEPAGAPAAAAVDAAAPAAPFAPALWVVRDADSTLYLYGTIHLRRPGSPWADDRVRAALASADEVWTELQIDPAADAALGPVVMRLGMAAPGQPLSSLLTPEQNERLGRTLVGLGLPANTFEPFRPWFAGINLSLLSLVRAGYDPNAGIDRQIAEAAGANGATMRWFETGEEQLGFLAGLSEPLQVQLLVDGIDTQEEGVALLDRMSAAWDAGDVALMEIDLIEEMHAEYPELYDVLIAQRNARWADTLDTEMQGAGVDFVAVGAGHLLGPDSVQALLTARGFTVERVY